MLSRLFAGVWFEFDLADLNIVLEI